jgi:hypothetical protein
MKLEGGAWWNPQPTDAHETVEYALNYKGDCRECKLTNACGRLELKHCLLLCIREAVDQWGYVNSADHSKPADRQGGNA